MYRSHFVFDTNGQPRRLPLNDRPLSVDAGNVISGKPDDPQPEAPMRHAIHELYSSGFRAKFTMTDGKTVEGTVKSTPASTAGSAVVIRSSNGPELHYLHVDHIIRIDTPASYVKDPNEIRATATIHPA